MNWSLCKHAHPHCVTCHLCPAHCTNISPCVFDLNPISQILRPTRLPHLGPVVPLRDLRIEHPAQTRPSHSREPSAHRAQKFHALRHGKSVSDSERQNEGKGNVNVSRSGETVSADYNVHIAGGHWSIGEHAVGGCLQTWLVGA